MPTTRPQPRPRPSRPAGFTLVEIMLALGLFLVGMISILVLFPMAVGMQQDGARQSGAMTVAHNVLSGLRADRSVDYPTAGTGADFQIFTPPPGRPIPIKLLNPHTGNLVSTDAGFDYRLAFRRVDPGDAFAGPNGGTAGGTSNVPVADWKIEAAVFIFQATGDDSIQLQKLPQPLTINNPDPEGQNLPTATTLTRNSVFLAQHASSKRTFVMRVVGPRRVEPQPPQPGQYNVYYVPGGADAVLTGWIR